MNLIITATISTPFKKLLFIFLFLCFSNLLIGQINLNTVVNQFGLKNSSSFSELQKAMNNYWASKNVQNSKVPNWKLYKRWEYYWEQRINQKSGEYPQTNSVIEYEKYKQSSSWRK